MSRLIDVMAETGMDVWNMSPAKFANEVREVVGRIPENIRPEYFADIALGRIAQ